MTGFQIKMQQKFDEESKNQQDKIKEVELDPILEDKGGPKMINTYEDATAKIANSVEIRDMKQDRNFLESYMRGGLGRK